MPRSRRRSGASCINIATGLPPPAAEMRRVKAELARIDQWMLESMQKWYKKETWGDSFAYALHAGRTDQPHAEDLLAQTAQDRKLPAIVRATAIQQRGLLPSVLARSSRRLMRCRTKNPQVRAAAVESVLRADSNSTDRLFDSGPAASTGRQSEADRAATSGTAGRSSPSRPRRNGPGAGSTTIVHDRQPAQWRQRQRLDTDIDEYITGVLQSNDRGGSHGVGRAL